MSTAKFELGRVVMTPGVAIELIDTEFEELLERHQNGDWGEMCSDDKKQNDYAVDRGHRIHSSYNVRGKIFWIITEWDRSVTTILRPSEY